MKKQSIVFHFPNVDTIYAHRTIFNGYKNAFLDLGWDFHTLSADDNQSELFESVQPDLFISTLHFLHLKYLDQKNLTFWKNKGMKVAINIPFWNSPISSVRVNEAQGLSQNREGQSLIMSGNYGDVFFNSCEQDDLRMLGFEEKFGIKHQTIPLAADTQLLKSSFSAEYESDICYVGTYLPEKRDFFKAAVFPLKDKYDVRIFGQDWSAHDRMLGWVQRAGQYLNVPVLKSIVRPKLSIADEGNIYASSKISLNIHEKYQLKFGGDCNERTFKVPLSGGFEICDNVSCVSRYFERDTEMVIADSVTDLHEKIEHYLRNPEERELIISKGKDRVLKDHTYHQRVRTMCNALGMRV